MASLVVRPEAEVDLYAAAVWYENERFGLGVEFLAAVRMAFERVEEHPLLFPLVAKSVRRSLVRKFPYGVFYALDDDVATVIAVLHLHRNPAEWQRRST